MTKQEKLTIKSLESILRKGDFDKLVGKIENIYFEAKPPTPYDLNDTISIEKFSSRVTSIANAKGGYIICGLKTDKVQASQDDVVIELDLVKKDAVYEADQLQGIINDTVYPKLEIITNWYPYVKDKTKGLFTIKIPVQEEHKKHFISTLVEIDEQIVKKAYVGIPIRENSQTKWASKDELYRLLKRSPNKLQELHDSLSEQIDELKDQIRNGAVCTEPSDTLEDKLEEVLDAH